MLLSIFQALNSGCYGTDGLEWSGEYCGSYGEPSKEDEKDWIIASLYSRVRRRSGTNGDNDDVQAEARVR